MVKSPLVALLTCCQTSDVRVGERDRVAGARRLGAGEAGTVRYDVLQAERVRGVGLRVEDVLQLAVPEGVPDLGGGTERVGEPSDLGFIPGGVRPGRARGRAGGRRRNAPGSIRAPARAPRRQAVRRSFSHPWPVLLTDEQRCHGLSLVPAHRDRKRCVPDRNFEIPAAARANSEKFALGALKISKRGGDPPVTRLTHIRSRLTLPACPRCSFAPRRRWPWPRCCRSSPWPRR